MAEEPKAVAKEKPKAKPKPPILYKNGTEVGIVYEQDKAYELLSTRKADEQGYVHCTVEESEAITGWWYHAAEKKIAEQVEALEIPWDDLVVTEEDIQEGNLIALSGKLAKISGFSVKINQLLATQAARLVASKEMLDHAVLRKLADPPEDREGPKLSIGVRSALAISQSKPLRHAKIDSVESGAFVKALETTRDSLDVLWRTCSRVISARLREPD